MSTTYDDLVKNIKATSGRTDSQTINAIPQFIAAAQSKLDSELRIAEMLVTTTYPADELAVTPVETLEMVSVIIDGIDAHQTTLAEIIRLRRAAGGEPLNVFAMNGKQIELVAPAEVVITAFARPPRITQSNPTNSYTEGAENALLWLSLSYLGVFARDSEATNAWMQLANSEIELSNESYRMFATSAKLHGAQNGYF